MEFCTTECDNRSGPSGAGNTYSGLTRSSDSTREGIGMESTHCAICCAPLTHPPTGRRRVYCSRACRLVARSRSWNASRDDGTPRACLTCGASLDGTRRSRKYCTIRCISEAKARRAGRKPIPPADVRFWSRISIAESGCWEWTGALIASGYGSIRVNDRGLVAHRFAWELLRGPIPDGLQVDHLCMNRKCCNPDHLEPVTQAENLRRARQHRRAALLTGTRPGDE